MISKLLYFRPDRRYVSDEELNATYTCTVVDELIPAESTITVPVYLTVIQHNIPKPCRGRRTQENKLSEKICVNLIGSQQAPALSTESTNLLNIDRVEFKGHLGFEKPVFEMISQFPSLRKISFFINPSQQRQFVLDQDWEENSLKLAKNLLVTNVNIIVKSCDPSRDIMGGLHEKVSAKSDICGMLMRILERMVLQCPNIKKLTMNVPDMEGMQSKILTCMKDLSLLKPTEVSSMDGKLIVRKCNDLMSPTSSEHMGIEQPDEDKDSGLRVSNGSTEGKSSESLDDQEQQPCLFDMSKLLGSMLGIPTSSLPVAPQLPSSLPSCTIVQDAPSPQDNDLPSVGSSTIIPLAKPELAKSSSSVSQIKRTIPPRSSTEVITYAAAACHFIP